MTQISHMLVIRNRQSIVCLGDSKPTLLERHGQRLTIESRLGVQPPVPCMHNTQTISTNVGYKSSTLRSIFRDQPHHAAYGLLSAVLHATIMPTGGARGSAPAVPQVTSRHAVKTWYGDGPLQVFARCEKKPDSKSAMQTIELGRGTCFLQEPFPDSGVRFICRNGDRMPV